MNCPECGSPITCIVNSRHKNGTIRRRRECEVCGNRFSTYEVNEKQWSVINNIAEIIKDGLKA